PRRIVIVTSRSDRENLLRIRASTICHEHRVTRIARVIHDAGAIRRPSHIDSTVDEEVVGCSAHERNETQSSFFRNRAGQQDFGRLREAHSSHGAKHLFFLTLCKIEKASSPDLAQPDVEWPIAIGTKYNELSIRRNRSVPLRTFKIGEPREPCVRKRVLGGGPAS